MQWTRLKMYNALHELSCHMTVANKAVLTTMNSSIGTKIQGLFVKPTMNWDGKDKTFDFVIHGQSDSH